MASARTGRSRFCRWASRTAVVAGATLLSLGCQQQQADAPQTVMVTGIWQAHLGTEERADLFEDLSTQGFRLADVSGYSVKGEAKYASVWLFGDGQGWRELHGVDQSALLKANAANERASLTLSHVSGFQTSKGPRFAAIWEPSFGGADHRADLRLALTTEELTDAQTVVETQPTRLVDVSAFDDVDGPRFNGIWMPQPEGLPKTELKIDLDAAALDAWIADTSMQGARVLRIGGYGVGAETRYFVLRVTAPGPLWMVRYDLTPSSYQVTLEDMVQVGYRISHLAAYTVKGEARYAVVWTQ